MSCKISRKQMDIQETQKSQRDKAWALFDDAKASMAKGDAIGAVVRLTQCLMADDGFSDAYLTRSELLLAMGDIDGAAADALWLTEHIEPTDVLMALKTRIAVVYKERGRMKYAAGDTVGAEQEVRKALQMDSNCMEIVSGQYTAEGVEQKIKRTFGMASAHNMAPVSNKGCHDCGKL